MVERHSLKVFCDTPSKYQLQADQADPFKSMGKMALTL